MYQAEQLDRQRKLEEERKYSQKMISEAYAIGDIVRVSIMDGEIQYNKNIYRTGSQGFILGNGEAKKISIYASGTNISEDIWFGYKNGILYVNFIPNINSNSFYIYEEDNSMYFSAKISGISKFSWRKDMLQMPNGFYVRKLFLEIRG